MERHNSSLTGKNDTFALWRPQRADWLIAFWWESWWRRQWRRRKRGKRRNGGGAAGLRHSFYACFMYVLKRLHAKCGMMQWHAAAFSDFTSGFDCDNCAMWFFIAKPSARFWDSISWPRNDSPRFIDLEIGAYTSTLESPWQRHKQGDESMYGTGRALLQSYMNDFVWKTVCGDNAL